MNSQLEFAVSEHISPAPIAKVSSSRNKNRNPKPCGNCSGSQVRCNVSPPYSTILCERCEEECLTECPPYTPRNNGRRRPVRRAPYKRRKDTTVNASTDDHSLPKIPEFHASSATEISQTKNESTFESLVFTEENASGLFQTARTEASTTSFEQILPREDTTGDIGWVTGGNIEHTPTSDSLGIWYPNVTSGPGGQIHVSPATFQPRFSYQNITLGILSLTVRLSSTFNGEMFMVPELLVERKKI